MKMRGTRLKFVTRLGYGDSLTDDSNGDGEVPVYGSNGPYAVTATPNTSAPAIVVGRKGSYGKVNWSVTPCFASDTTFFIDGTLTEHDLRWLYWTLTTLGLDEGSGEAAVPGINRETIYEKRIRVPPVPVQSRIANYLDAETSAIDGLIAEKEQMLSLLEEKRAALVTHAVTRDLNPNAPLKPSGLEWLGENPKHWAIMRFKHFCHVGNGSTPSRDNLDYWEGGKYPWLNSSVVGDRVVQEASRFVTETALKECHLPRIEPPALLVAITGQGKTRGRSTVLTFEATINQHLAYLKPHTDTADCYYLNYLMDTAYAFIRSDSDGAGSTRGAITCEQLANFRIPLPPRKEQQAIVHAIRAKTERFDSMAKWATESIRLLKERRSALITAAVTGQIPMEEMAA